MDDRPYERVAGLLVKGQPCVWCGGRACTDNNDNLCHLTAIEGGLVEI